MKQNVKKLSLVLSFIVVIMAGFIGNISYDSFLPMSSMALDNVEALADGEYSNCYFQFVHIDPYTGRCYCGGYGSLCCEC